MERKLQSFWSEMSEALAGQRDGHLEASTKQFLLQDRVQQLCSPHKAYAALLLWSFHRKGGREARDAGRLLCLQGKAQTSSSEFLFCVRMSASLHVLQDAVM